MNNFSTKKISKVLSLLVVFAFLFSLVGMTADIQAKNKETTNPPMKREIKDPPVYNIDQASERLANMFEVDKSTILNYCVEGYKVRELYIIGIITKASGRSFKEVMALKTPDNNFFTIAKELGVSQEDAISISEELSLEEVVEYLQIDRAVFDNLVAENYRYRDIVLAGIVSKHAKKPISEIVLLKKINNTWFEVAADFNITVNGLLYDAENFDEYMSLFSKHPWTRIGLRAPGEEPVHRGPYDGPRGRIR
ncbi:hypothetical protein LJC10_00290 [Selenomonadales bacterium OttesenSCG-928-I06]|nr:hypothetical protein [Selenomonadales bacterium OttesenSCG-928-I06]